MYLVAVIISLLISYLIGSVPTAYIFGKCLKGIDIRQHGSGNVGATNAFRVLGKGPGLLIFILDILKGVLAVALTSSLFGLDQPLVLVLLGIAVVGGHNWTLFLQFKGGKGMATSLGVLIGLTVKIAAIRPVLVLSVIIWIFTFILSGFISLASVVSSICLPILMVLSGQSFEMISLGIIFCMFIVLRHRSNIQRLISKGEPRVDFPFKKR